jgi:hypothetical protein
MQTRGKGASRKWRGCVVNHALRRDARHSVACRYLCVCMESTRALQNIYNISTATWAVLRGSRLSRGALLLLRTRVQAHKIDQGQL